VDQAYAPPREAVKARSALAQYTHGVHRGPRIFFALLGLFGPLGAHSAGAQEERVRPARPNVLLILADDLGWKDVGYQGSAYPTPNIDRLAREGLVLSHAYAASPCCSPSRAALLTGRHPARLGLTRATRNRDYLEERDPSRVRPTPAHMPWLDPGSRTHLPEGTPTLGERLGAAGYATAFVGKWHIGEPPHDPHAHGFPWAHSVGFYSASPYFPPYSVQLPKTKPQAGYLTDQLTEDALAFLREPRERPFFLVLAHFAVHGPWQAKPELVERFRKELDPAAPQGNATYAAMIASLDEGVGRVLDELDRLGLAESTLVLFTSDNGPSLAKDEPLTSVAPLRGGKLDLYEGGLRVPFVARWKGTIRAQSQSAYPASFLDLYPTLLDLCGLERGPGEAPDGLDLAPLFAGEELPARGPLYFYVPHGRRPRAAVLDGGEKLVRYFGGADELYDLGADPGEAHDLAGERATRARALGDDLAAWLARMGVRPLERNPGYDPAAPVPGQDDEREE